MYIVKLHSYLQPPLHSMVVSGSFELVQYVFLIVIRWHVPVRGNFEADLFFIDSSHQVLNERAGLKHQWADGIRHPAALVTNHSMKHFSRIC